jgi:hypothetical protein
MKVAVARSRTHVLLQKPLQPQLLTKTLDQDHSCEVGEAFFLEGKKDFSEAFRHCTQSYLLGEVVCKQNIGQYVSRLSSENQQLIK